MNVSHARTPQQMQRDIVALLTTLVDAEAAYLLIARGKNERQCAERVLRSLRNARDAVAAIMLIQPVEQPNDKAN